MALNGTPKDQVTRYLKEKFDLDDPTEIIDEAFSRAGR
jgi:hypothetical protein